MGGTLGPNLARVPDKFSIPPLRKNTEKFSRVIVYVNSKMFDTFASFDVVNFRLKVFNDLFTCTTFQFMKKKCYRFTFLKII